MPKNPAVDAYIEKQAEFARPILSHLRDAMHRACPDCEEAIKWGMPAFLYRGKQLAGMAAFKAHATFGFRHGPGLLEGKREQAPAMGQFGRLTALDDLPAPKDLEELIKQAMAAVESGTRPARKPVKATVAPPADLLAAIEANSAASVTFAAFPPGARRDYVDWVLDAKRAETRKRRIAQTVEWLAEGKRRNWKYEAC